MSLACQKKTKSKKWKSNGRESNEKILTAKIQIGKSSVDVRRIWRIPASIPDLQADQVHLLPRLLIHQLVRMNFTKIFVKLISRKKLMMILTQLLIHSILVVFLGIDFQRFMKQKFANNLDYRISVHFLILPSTFFKKKTYLI